MDTRKYKLTIAYDGTAYQGWQLQKVGLGVQEKVEGALAKLYPSAPRLHSSSRTDTGVHALGMVAHFEVPLAEAKLPARRIALALNAWLPDDIRVQASVQATKDFHARFHASGKQYRYYVWNLHAMNPLLQKTAWHVTRKLDLKKMRAAAKSFPGEHDFQSFTAKTDYEPGTTTRRLTRCDISKSGPLYTFTIEGEGFLYRMCRGIVGTLVQIGFGRFPPEAIKVMLTKKDRRTAGMSAPAHGLVLQKVFYRKPLPVRRLKS
jgi:tRNA pseudouridine38-40 synthase